MKTKDIKIFVSSTFYDMQIERDLLKNIVKKDLEARFSNQGVSIEIIDLRWGVNVKEEQDFETQVLQVCMKEILECKPFFISFLGERYGWIPEEKLIEKSCSFMTDDDYKMICEEKGISVTEMEILYGAFRKEAELDNCVFCFRDSASYDGIKSDKKSIYFDEQCNAIKLEKLKNKIRKRCREKNEGKIIDYHLSVAASYSEQIDSLSSFALELSNWLFERINHIENSNTQHLIPDHVALVNEFVSQHSINYIRRESIEKQLLDYIYSNTSPFIVISGDSGLGKSYLLSYVYSFLKEQEDYIPLLYSTNFNTEKCNSKDVLESWTIQLSYYLNLSDEITSNSGALSTFNDLIREAANQHKHIVLFLDAVESMYDDSMSQNLTFIPEGLTTIITVIDSSIDFQKFHKQLKHIRIPTFTRNDAVKLFDNIFNKSHFYLKREQMKTIMEKKKSEQQYAYESPLWVNLLAGLLINLDNFDFFASKQLTLNKKTKIYGKYADFINSIHNEDLTPDDYIFSLIRYIPSDYENLFLFMIDKSFSYFGRAFVVKYLSLLCISKYGLGINEFELLYNDSWNMIKFTQVHRWFSGVITNANSGASMAFRHKSIKRILMNNWSNEIKDTRYSYISIMQPHFLEYDSIKKKNKYKDIEKNNFQFLEFIHQLLVTNRYAEIAKICNSTSYEKAISLLLYEQLRNCDRHIDGKYAPIWYRYPASIQNIDYSKSELEQLIIRIVELKSDIVRGNNYKYNEYYWMLCYNLGISLMKESLIDIALPLYYILTIKIQELSKQEDKESLIYHFLGHQTYHNMLTICNGNLSSLCSETHQYQAALQFLSNRHEAYLNMIDDNTSYIDKEANTGFYHYQYGSIMEKWIGLKPNTIQYYQDAINTFSKLEKEQVPYLYQYIYCGALSKLSNWYEKKNNIEKAEEFAYKAFFISESHIQNDGLYELGTHSVRENLKEYFVCSMNLIELCKRLNLSKTKYQHVSDKAWKLIQQYYPDVFGDSDFRSLFLFFQKESLGNAQIVSETEIDKLNALFSDAYEDAFKNKHKNQAINKFIEVAKFAESLYTGSGNLYIKEKLALTCFLIGYLYQTKSDTSKFLPLSNEYLIKAINYGYFDAYDILAHNAKKVGDLDKAEKYLELGAAKESIICYRDYAICLFEKDDFTSGARYLEYAIERGDVLAKIHKAIFMFNGEYGYGTDKQGAIDILTNCVNIDHDQIAAELLRKASYFAYEFFSCGIDYKLPHIT